MLSWIFKLNNYISENFYRPPPKIMVSFTLISIYFRRFHYGQIFEYLLLTSQDFPTQRHHKLFDSVEFLLLLAF